MYAHKNVFVQHDNNIDFKFSNGILIKMKTNKIKTTTTLTWQCPCRRTRGIQHSVPFRIHVKIFELKLHISPLVNAPLRVASEVNLMILFWLASKAHTSFLWNLISLRIWSIEIHPFSELFISKFRGRIPLENAQLSSS